MNSDHVPWNLQVMPFIENIKNHNRFPEVNGIAPMHQRGASPLSPLFGPPPKD